MCLFCHVDVWNIEYTSLCRSHIFPNMYHSGGVVVSMVHICAIDCTMLLANDVMGVPQPKHACFNATRCRHFCRPSATVYVGTASCCCCMEMQSRCNTNDICVLLFWQFTCNKCINCSMYTACVIWRARVGTCIAIRARAYRLSVSCFFVVHISTCCNFTHTSSTR